MQKNLQETAARVEKIAGTPAFLTAQALDDNRGETAIWLAGALMALCDTVYKAFEKIINHRGGWKRCPHLDKYGVFWDVEKLLAIGTALNKWDAEILESLKQERKAAELENVPWATDEDLRHLFGEDR